MPNDWWGLASSQFWQVTLLIPAAIFLARWLGRGRSHLAYGLLIVVLLKCVTPPLWSSRVGLFSWAERLADSNVVSTDAGTFPPARASETVLTADVRNAPFESPGERTNVETAQVEGAVETPEIESSRAEIGVTDVNRDSGLAETTTGPGEVSAVTAINWRWVAGLAFGAVWVAGVCVAAGGLIWGTWRLRRWCGSANPADQRIRNQAHRLARQMGLPSTPDVLVTDEAVMPAAAGVWREVVLLPRHLLDSVSPEEFELVLAHELNHFRRWDTLIGGLQAVAQVLWWFHPLVWWLNREMRRYREQCCDEEILARLECRPPEYARCLLNVLELNERFSPALGLAGMSPFEVTSQRLRNIMRSRAGFTASMPRWCWLVLIGSALVVLPGAGLTLDANALPRVEGVYPGTGQGDETRTTEVGISVGDVDGNDPVDAAELVTPDELAYRWRQGEYLSYRLYIEVDLGDEIEVSSGTKSLSVRSAGERGAELVLGGMGLTSHRRPKPGRMPRLGGFTFPGFPPPTYGLPLERSVRVDASGRILTERGELERLPGLLGSWPSYVLQPLPEQVANQWSVQSTEMLLFEADRFREETVESRLGGPYRQPATEALRVAQEADYALTTADDGTFVIVKQYTLATVEQVNGQPRAEMSGVKSVTWDVERGIPVSIVEDSRLIVREGNVATTYPLTVNCELLQPAAEAPGAVDNTGSDEIAPATPVTYDGPAPVPSSDLPVTEDTDVGPGDVVQVEWSGRWYPADVLGVEENGRLRIHFRGFSEQWDDAVHHSRVQLPGPEFSAEDKSRNSWSVGDH